VKQAIYCALISAVIGFIVAAYLFTPRPSPSSIIDYVLCPPGIFAAILLTDADPESIWLFFGPLNALIYGAVGFTLWLFVVGDDDNSPAPLEKPRDRPLGL
jgi:hypothetical protein